MLAGQKSTDSVTIIFCSDYSASTKRYQVFVSFSEEEKKVYALMF